MWEKEKLLVTVFSKGLFPKGVKRCYCVGNGLMPEKIATDLEKYTYLIWKK